MMRIVHLLYPEVLWHVCSCSTAARVGGLGFSGTVIQISVLIRQQLSPHIAALWSTVRTTNFYQNNDALETRNCLVVFG